MLYGVWNLALSCLVMECNACLMPEMKAWFECFGERGWCGWMMGGCGWLGRVDEFGDSFLFSRWYGFWMFGIGVGQGSITMVMHA